MHDPDAHRLTKLTETLGLDSSSKIAVSNSYFWPSLLGCVCVP